MFAVSDLLWFSECSSVRDDLSEWEEVFFSQCDLIMISSVSQTSTSNAEIIWSKILLF